MSGVSLVTACSKARLGCRACPCLHSPMPDDDVLPFDLAGCLAKARRHNQPAAHELVDQPYPLLTRIARPTLPSRVAEENLAQEVCMKMFTRPAQYQCAVHFPP